MKRLTLALPLALLLAHPAAAVPVRTVEQSYRASGLSVVRAELEVGELRVVAGEGDSVRVTMIARCRRSGGSCERRARRLRLESDVFGSELRVRVQHYPTFLNGGLRTELHIEVPATMRLQLHLGVGELAVRGVRGDVAGHLGVGSASFRGDPATVGSVQLHVGFGEAALLHNGRRHEATGFIGHSLSWSEGLGASSVVLDVGVGEAEVALR